MDKNSVLAQVGAKMGFSAEQIALFEAEAAQIAAVVTPFDDALLEELGAFPELDVQSLFAETDALLQRLGIPPSPDPRCQAKTRKGERCHMRTVGGTRACRLHGGLSTGAKTEAGRERLRESNRRRSDAGAKP